MLFSTELPWCCFLCGNESSPNELKLFDNFFWNKRDPRSFVEGPEGEGVGHKTPGRAWALASAPVGCAHPEAHLSVKPTPKIPINRETIRGDPKKKKAPPPPSASLNINLKHHPVTPLSL